MRRVIGLDASTTTVGICILDYDEDGYVPQLVHWEYLKPDKKLEITEKVLSVRQRLFDLIDGYGVNEFAIEDYIRYMQGQSSAQTIIPLAILNMTLRIGVKDRYGWEPTAMTVGKIRHALKRDHILPKKEDMPDLVASCLNMNFPWMNRFMPRKKVWRVMDESYDVADAMAVALAYVKLRSRPPKKVRSNSKKKAKKRKVKK